MSPKPITTNTLFYGDNLPILREYIAGESIDLIYLDPPFNSNRSYNVLFKDESGHEAESQVRAFDDTWHWGPTPAATYQELITHAPERVGRVLEAFQQLIGSTSQMMAYSPGWNKDYPRIQILTIEDLLRGAEAKLPPTEGTFKQAPRVQEEAKQGALGL